MGIKKIKSLKDASPYYDAIRRINSLTGPPPIRCEVTGMKDFSQWPRCSKLTDFLEWRVQTLDLNRDYYRQFMEEVNGRKCCTCEKPDVDYIWLPFSGWYITLGKVGLCAFFCSTLCMDYWVTVRTLSGYKV